MTIRKSMKKKRVVTKILKLDENKQYGYSMRKPLPTGCVKENKNFSWVYFNILIESIDLKDKIGHLFVVDIYLTLKMQTRSSYFIMKFFHQLLRNRKFLKCTNFCIPTSRIIWQNKRETKVVPLHSKITRKFIPKNIYSAWSRRFEISD